MANMLNNKTVSFQEMVYQAVQKIPRGKVSTYGSVASMIGKRGAGRAVGNALNKNRNSDLVPCHRVVNSKGDLAKNFGMGGRDSQKEKLIKEGVEVENYQVPAKFIITL